MAAINIPKELVLAKGTVELIEFFNKLAADLEYPKCEGNADARRILSKAERELIMWGKV
jgi:hypothetical protein